MTAARWQGWLDRFQGEGRLPSVVAGVVVDGRLAWGGGSGAVPGEATDVQYRIGSITKTLVAVAVLRCREAGLLSLDDPIGRFVPETGYAASTIRSLLTHTSGMQSEPVGSWWERSPGTDVEVLLDANDGSGRVAAPGEFFHYSNLGFALLGEAVARLRGASWWDVVATEVLGPLGMTRTSYRAEGPAAQGWSVGHFTGTLTPEPHQDTGAMAPAGQAWSTVSDLGRWAGFLATGHGEVLPVEVLREAARPAAADAGYGLGLRVIPWRDGMLVGHTGSMPGFLASCFADPGSGSGAVVLANATTGLATERAPVQLLGEEDPGEATPWVPTAQVPDALADILGLWFWGNTAVELRWNNEQLEMWSLTSREWQERFALDGRRIVGVEGYHRGETLHVVRRPDGAVSHLECATFVYTRTPYDPQAPIPGGLPEDRDGGSAPR